MLLCCTYVPQENTCPKARYPRRISFFDKRLRTGLSVLGLVTDGQLPAPFRATAREHLPAVLRCHAGTESVLVTSLAAAGLKCTLHMLFKIMVIFLTEL